jgi:hypothetical protein
MSLVSLAGAAALAAISPEAPVAAPVEEVVVVANRIPVAASDSGRSVTVIPEAVIRDRQALVIPDLLASTPGVGVSRNGGPGGVTAVRIRGAEAEQTLAGRVHAFLRAAVHAQGDDGSAAAFMVTSVLECQRRPELGAEGTDSLQRTRDFAAAAVRADMASWPRSASASFADFRADMLALSVERPPHAPEAAAEMLVAALWGLGFYAGFVGGQDRLTAITDEFIRLLDGGPWMRTG